MKRLFSYVFYGMMGLATILFNSCSELNKLSPDESLLIKNKVRIHPDTLFIESVHIEDSLNLSKKQKKLVKKQENRFNAKSLNNYLRQVPNSTFLGMRMKLAFYNSAKDSIYNWWNDKLREMGEAPVVFDSTSIPSSIDNLRNFLANRGYFSPKITYKIKTKKRNDRKIIVEYHITPGPVHRIQNIRLNVDDDSLKPYFSNWEKERLIIPQSKYDINVLDQERERVSDILRQQGYYSFSKEYINFLMDSSMTQNTIDVQMNINRITSIRQDSLGNPILLNHKKFYLDSIFFIPESYGRLQSNGKYDTMTYTYTYTDRRKKKTTTHNYHIVYQGEKPIIKPRVLAEKTFLTEGSLFNSLNLKKSYENLNDLRVFGFTNIDIKNKPYDSNFNYFDNNKLSTSLRLRPSPKYGFSAEAEITASSGVGASANLTFQDRNIFRGGEIFHASLKGEYELQAITDANRSFYHTYEIKAEVGIEFPRFLAPIRLERFTKYFRPKSKINLSYSFQSKQDYSRGIFDLSWGYTWKKDFWTHTFNPIEINTVQMLNTTQEFFEAIETMGLSNPRIKHLYEDHFILNLKYSFVYNEQTIQQLKDFNYFRFNVETAGNLLYGIARGTRLKQNEYGQYTMFNLAFAQYVKLDADYKHYFIFKKDVSLIFKAMVGAGFYYGNSKSLPYEKSYYIGGSNSMRSWRIYELGPGSYQTPDKNTIERLGDIIFLVNLEQRFPIVSGLKGAVFMDAGNIWLLKPNSAFPDGEFKFSKIFKDLAWGTGVGLRYDFGFFLIRLDVGIPLYDPSETAQKWVINNLKFNRVVWNFGIGYPF